MKADDCLEWLDSKPAQSVVYISFGSVVYLSQEQVNEIAHGLLNSGVSFLWVMKPPHKDAGVELLVLPEGFLEKAGDNATVGFKATEMKQNALKWKAAAEEAVAEGGSSDRNIQAFVDEVRTRSAAITGKSTSAIGADLDLASKVELVESKLVES
uniref:Uncharacterized protein n=1 Tax=Fagus sylvatica TaxID=28930 RepID=A0A2N9HJA6_FAGSY